jgi:hypothetical protein
MPKMADQQGRNNESQESSDDNAGFAQQLAMLQEVTK